MAVIPIIRLCVLGVTTLFSVIVLALTAHLTSQSQQYFNYTDTSSSLGIAVSVISLLTLPVMLIVDLLRRGAFTSMIVVELAWLFVLCVLWVATAGQSVSDFDRFAPFGCGVIANLSPIGGGMCEQAQAVEAFTFLNFIIILLYIILLSVMALIAATRGQSVWLSSVKESFGSSDDPVQYPMTQHNASAPPQQQQGAHHAGTPAQARYGSDYTQHSAVHSSPATEV